MIEFSIALVIISLLTFYLVNKWLNQRQVELDRTFKLNTMSSEEEVSAAINKALKAYDDRINNTWEAISSHNKELESLKLQVAMRNR